MTAITAIRRLTITLSTALLLSAPAQSQFAAVQQLPYIPKGPPAFGDALLVEPVDVAVMSWCGSLAWTFVADEISNQITRFIITPTGNAVGAFQFTYFQTGPYGVAVNDIPGHPENGRVYATGTDLVGFPAVVVFDKFGNVINRFYGDPSDRFVDPRGIAVGPKGNVYVVDKGRRITEEFESDKVDAFSAATPENKYGPFQAVEPWDVSVDIMRRVHVTGYEYFPFPVGRYDVYRYGDTLPTMGVGTGPSTFSIAGIDARSLAASHHSDADAEVHRVAALNTVWPGWTFGAPGTQIIPTGAAAVDHLGGLETQRTWRIYGLSGTDLKVRCDNRVFVTDKTDGQVEVLQSYKVSTPRPADAIAWWRLDESSGTSAKDFLNSRHGSWVGGGLAPSEGVVRCAMTFNGGSSGIQVPTHAILEVDTLDFSLEGWMRAEVQSGVITFLDNRSLSGTGYRAILDDGALGFEIDDGVDSHTTQSATQVDDGKWHHVGIAVERGVSTRLYVDGALVATGASGGVTGSLSSGATLYIGQDNTTGTTGLLGGLDEVTLYHRALAGGEFSAIDSVECAGKHLPPSVFSGGVHTSAANKLKLPNSAYHF